MVSGANVVIWQGFKESKRYTRNKLYKEGVKYHTFRLQKQIKFKNKSLKFIFWLVIVIFFITMSPRSLAVRSV